MTRSTTHRAVVSLVAAAGLLLAGCSAGQIAETARKNPSVPGANADRQVRDAKGKVIGSVAVRDVLVAYQDPAGYERGGNAPLVARVFNDTGRPVTVTVTPGQPAPASGQVVAVASVALVEAKPASTPQPNATAPSSPAGTPAPGASPVPTGSAPAPVASFDIPAGGFAVLSQDSGQYLLLTGLSGPLTPGMSVPLRFQFSNGPELAVTAPVANPLSRVQRATPEREQPGSEH